jgi:hypothetical protein
MRNLDDLLVGLMGTDFVELLSCIGANEARSRSPVSGSGKGKPRRSPQARGFKAAKKAVREGDFVALSGLIKSPKQANWYASDRAWCLLDEAVKAGSATMVKWLLEKGANPNTLFMHDKPYDIRKGIVSGWYFSPFASAMKLQNMEMVSMMLAHGADLSLPVVWDSLDDNMTCRDLAVEDGFWPSVEAIVLAQSLPSSQTGNTKRL